MTDDAHRQIVRQTLTSSDKAIDTVSGALLPFLFADECRRRIVECGGRHMCLDAQFGEYACDGAIGSDAADDVHAGCPGFTYSFVGVQSSAEDRQLFHKGHFEASLSQHRADEQTAYACT